MTTHKKLSARILSMALSVALVCTMLPTTALAAEGDTPLGASSINTVGTIKSFDKLEDRFSPSTGTNAPDHVYSLSVALNKPVEELQLPSELSAMVEITTTKPAEDVKDSGKVEETTTTTAQKNVAVSWNSDKEYKSDVNGQLIYTAVLPEGYTLAEGVNLPQIYVMVGRQARATGDAITITVNGSTTAVGGATLQAVVEANGGATAVTSLKITAGEVTTADWEYLKNLTILTTFEIAETIADGKVANIPTKNNTLFPKSIVSVTVPQAITIGERAFQACNLLTTASFPAATSIDLRAFENCTLLANTDFSAATSIGNFAFQGCNALTSVSFPNAASINYLTFFNCTSLATASFPAAATIVANAFESCTALATLNLPATPPTVANANAFKDCPTTRALGYLAADGTALTGTALTNAQAAYKAASDGSTTDEKWYGWTIAAASTHVPVTGITGVPTTATVGTNLTLSGTVAPTTATNKTIVWSVKTAGNTGATISGSTLSTTAAGTVVVTATITNGKTASTNYTQDFTITVSAASTPSPTILPDSGGNYVFGNGTPLVIEKDGTGTTIYIDTNENGVKDSGEKSLADAGITSAPVNGADLSTWRIYGGSNTAEVTGNTLVTMNDGEINTLCAGSRVGNINGNVHLTVNGGKISGWQLITGNANGGTITGNSTIEINDGEIKIVMVGSPNRNPVISGNCTVTIKGGTITGQLMNNGTINGTKTVTITGGACALNNLSGITPTNVGGEDLELYKFTLSDATSTEIVNSITLVENYAYNLNGVAATATLGVFLPKTGKTFTKATVSTDLETYAGSISNKAATLVKTVYTPVTGITGVPTTATVGTTLTLSGTVAPTTATNKTIVWSVKTAGTTGATISGSTLSTTAAGTVVVTATITNGATASTHYTQDFTITVSAPKTPASIAVTTPPTKTTYTAGETFNKAGMVVTATYIDSTTAAVSGYTFSPTRALATTDTTITISYTENGTTVTTTQAITVSGGGGSGGGGGGSTGGGTTTPAGGTAGGTNTPGKTVIDNPVGSTGSTNPLAEAVKNATAAGTTNTTAYVNYANYTALTVDGLKAINDAAAAAVKDKNVKLSTKIQLDNTVGNVVLSRVTVDPAKLSAVMPDRLDLGIWFNQATDTEVIAVNERFDKYFTNKLVTITFEEKTPLAVNMVLALKPNFSGLNTKNLHFYSYNPTTNIYTRIAAPAYWVDKNGYSHITAPFGGSIIITDTPLTVK